MTRTTTTTTQLKNQNTDFHMWLPLPEEGGNLHINKFVNNLSVLETIWFDKTSADYTCTEATVSDWESNVLYRFIMYNKHNTIVCILTTEDSARGFVIPVNKISKLSVNYFFYKELCKLVKVSSVIKWRLNYRRQLHNITRR